MSKISTIYDKKIGKCLIVRGSEAYAHTTDVLMEVGTIKKTILTVSNQHSS